MSNTTIEHSTGADHDPEESQGALSSNLDSLPIFNKQPDTAADTVLPPSTPNRANNRIRRGIIGGAAGLAATAALAATLTFGGAKADDAPKGPTDESLPDGTSQIEPGTSTGNEIDTPNNSGEVEITGEVLEQTMTIEQMDAITDIEAYAQLSYADHLAYAVAKAPNFPVSTPNNDFAAEDPSSIPGYFWQQTDAAALFAADPLVGAKIIAAKFYNTTTSEGAISPAYESYAQHTLAAPGSQGNDGLSIYVSDEGAFTDGVDRDGNAVEKTNITFYTKKNGTNERTSEDITVETFRVQVKLLDGATVIYYPQGYAQN